MLINFYTLAIDSKSRRRLSGLGAGRSDSMRVVFIVAASIIASISALTTPSHASSSCMSKSEARQHYGSVHIYWHGPDHCWDATPGRHRLVRKNQSNVDRQAERGSRRSDWRQAMSEMLPE